MFSIAGQLAPISRQFQQMLQTTRGQKLLHRAARALGGDTEAARQQLLQQSLERSRVKLRAHFRELHPPPALQGGAAGAHGMTRGGESPRATPLGRPLTGQADGEGAAAARRASGHADPECIYAAQMSRLGLEAGEPSPRPHFHPKVGLRESEPFTEKEMAMLLRVRDKVPADVWASVTMQWLARVLQASGGRGWKLIAV